MLNLLTWKLLVTEQKIVLQLEFKPHITRTQFLPLANEVFQKDTDLPTFNFARVYFTRHENLVFDTSFATRDTYYETYFSDLCQIHENYFTITWNYTDTRSFKFFLHYIPLNAPIGDISSSLWINYLELTLADTSQWLITDESKHTTKKYDILKRVSAVIIAILEHPSLWFLGLSQLPVCNN